jgi:hypothetical protein
MGQQPNNQTLIRLYSFFLRLYPADFQQEFAEEMQWVFSQSISEAVEQGLLERSRTIAREIYGAIWGAVRQNLEQSAVRRFFRPAGVPGWEGAPGRGEVLLTLMLFLLPALGLMRREALAALNGPLAIIAAGLVTGALLTGLSRGLPRWSLPYLGIALSTISFFVIFDWQADLLSPMAMEKLNLFPQSSSMRLVFQALWAGMMWLELFLLTFLTLGLLALLRRFRPFLHRLRQDWTLGSYILYSGALTLLTLSFMQHQSIKLFAAGSILCLAAGAWLYLYSPRAWQRWLTLITGLTLSMLMAVAGNWPVVPLNLSPVWQNWPAVGSPFWSRTQAMLVEWVWMAVILLAPALLKLVRPPGERPLIARE